jgi:hypothetical protein
MQEIKTSYTGFIVAATLSLAGLGLGGCASGNHLITANTNPVNGEPVYQAPPPSAAITLEERAHQIRHLAGQELQALLSYAQVNPNVFTDVKVQNVGLKTEIKFVSSKKGFYPAGVYLLNKIDRSEDRDGLIFTDLVVNATQKVLDAVKDSAGEVIIEATYAAQADGLPIRSLRYKGEFGDVIHLPSQITSLNGQPVEVHVTKGQAINNGQLAALRAVSLAAFFHGALRTYSIEDKYILTTTNERGPQQRWVELTVKIAPAP